MENKMKVKKWDEKNGRGKRFQVWIWSCMNVNRTKKLVLQGDYDDHAKAKMVAENWWSYGAKVVDTQSQCN